MKALVLLSWAIGLYGVPGAYAAELAPREAHLSHQENVERDPFHPPNTKPCAPLPALIQQGKLVGMMSDTSAGNTTVGNTTTRSAWLLSANGKWQKIAIDWQIENSGWYVAAIAPDQIELVNDSAMCGAPQHHFLTWTTASKEYK